MVGHGGRGVQERFFVIEKGYLSYYASEAVGCCGVCFVDVLGRGAAAVHTTTNAFGVRMQNHIAGAPAIKGWHIHLCNYTLDRMVRFPSHLLASRQHAYPCCVLRGECCCVAKLSTVVWLAVS